MGYSMWVMGLMANGQTSVLASFPPVNHKILSFEKDRANVHASKQTKIHYPSPNPNLKLNLTCKPSSNPNINPNPKSKP